jgi:hypothetical protein
MMANAAPEIVTHTCKRGRQALAYLTSLPLQQELFTLGESHNIDIDVNHADVNGDTALHMAMLRCSGARAVESLLQKGAEVLGVGYGGTTVLMKPFLTVDEDVINEQYGNCEFPDEADYIDVEISTCLQFILDHVLYGSDARAFAPVCQVDYSVRANREMQWHASAAKRQRL